MNGYVVTVEVLLDGHSPTDPRIDDDLVYAALGDLTDYLTDYAGVVAGDGRGWEATVTLDVENHDTAVAAALPLVLERAEKAGLQIQPIVRVNAVREDVRDAELEKPNLPALVSGPEAAEILGVNRQRVHQLATQNPRFPKPLYRLAVGSLWDRRAIEQFDAEWERKPGRPPKPDHPREQATSAPFDQLKRR
ncbi:hypothetical protein [Amycolatopsis sp. CFH S0078]|uniref:hypothetical protein n=1 Tax=Amycolatopsis sp. CFH S0078 TaxID=1644108 RepID=UPI00106E8901|nr:hypothetical protein [Amycolatopsis sp. CFH S0078]